MLAVLCGERLDRHAGPAGAAMTTAENINSRDQFNELVTPALSTNLIESAITQDIDRSFGGRSGHACLGYIEGDPLVDDMRQEFFHLPTQRAALIARAVKLESQFGDIYIGQCLFQRIEEFGHRGRSVYAVARDYAHALPHNEIWKDDVKDPHTVATRLIETSPGNYQALITLDRDCTPAERKRLMTAWRGDDGDTCSNDAVHFRRLAGGRNTKPGNKNFRVHVAADTGRTYPADKLLARCEPERESTHTPGSFSSADWQELSSGELLWTSPRWQALATRQRPQLKTLLIDKEPIPLANKRTGKTNDDSWSNQRAVFVKNALEAYDPPPLEEIRAVALYFREYLGERKTDREYQNDIDRLIGIYLDQLYTQRGKVYSPKPTKYIPGQHTPGVIKPKAPRGRAGSHADLVENVYNLLLDAGDGHTAQVKISQIASTIGADRRTISTILGELRAAGRIETRQIGQHGGLHITFSGRIYSAEAIAESSTATPETDETAIRAIESTGTNQQDLGLCVLSDRANGDHASEPAEPPPSLQAAVALVLSQVDPKEFGRARLKTVRETLAVVYGYADTDAVNREIKVQESIFGKERRDCWRMQPDALVARIQARTTSLARNIGKRQEGKYRKLAQIAQEVCKRRGLKMPERPTKEKPIRPSKAAQQPPAVAQPAILQPDLFADAPLAPEPVQPAYRVVASAHFAFKQAQRQQALQLI